MTDLSTASALWITSREHAEIRTESLPPPRAGEVLVEALYSGVSRGTELLVFGGRVPESEHERMRAPHQAGAFPWPVKYGYASVGTVRQGPSALLGRHVFCLFPHQSAYVVPESAVVPLPTGVPPERAVLGANLETALNGCWDAGITAGDKVAVVGAGVVGALVAALASRYPGTEVELVDIDPTKAVVAQALGVPFAQPDTARRDADVVIHASGAPEGLDTALALAGNEAAIVEMSWYGDRPTEVSLGTHFHSKRLRITASQVGQLPPSQRARWTHRRRLELALSFLTDARFDALISGEGPLSELPAHFEAILRGAPSLCHRVRYL